MTIEEAIKILKTVTKTEGDNPSAGTFPMAIELYDPDLSGSEVMEAIRLMAFAPPKKEKEDDDG